MVTIKTVAYVGIALAIFYILTATLIIPQFSASWRYSCSALQWKPAAGEVVTNCTNVIVNANTSAVTAGSSYTQEGYNSPTAAGVASSYCLDCTTMGPKTTTAGMVLFIMIIGIIFIAVTFLKYTK